MYKVILTLIIVLLFSSISFAKQIQLPSGNFLNIDNLTQEEISRAIELDLKSSKKEKVRDTVSDVVKNIDPTKLDEWRKLITGTIKDICNDLNVSVNEFVKTPVGLGISALIIYKVAGKELLDNAFDIILMIPLWIFVTGFCLYIAWYCFSYKIVYQRISYDDKGRKVKTEPSRMTRYNWDTHNDDGAAKTVVITWLMAIELLFTALTMLIVLI